MTIELPNKLRFRVTISLPPSWSLKSLLPTRLNRRKRIFRPPEMLRAVRHKEEKKKRFRVWAFYTRYMKLKGRVFELGTDRHNKPLPEIRADVCPPLLDNVRCACIEHEACVIARRELGSARIEPERLHQRSARTRFQSSASYPSNGDRQCCSMDL